MGMNVGRSCDVVIMYTDPQSVIQSANCTTPARVNCRHLPAIIFSNSKASNPHLNHHHQQQQQQHQQHQQHQQKNTISDAACCHQTNEVNPFVVIMDA